jgi:hypothetical protein
MTRTAKLRILKTLLVVNVVLLALAGGQLLLFPQYHRIRLNMTVDEVQKIMRDVEYDVWGTPHGGTACYYHYPFGTVTVVFDAKNRVVYKGLSAFGIG